MDPVRVLLLGEPGVGKTLFVERHLLDTAVSNVAAICKFSRCDDVCVYEASGEPHLQAWAWLCLRGLPIDHVLIFVQDDAIFGAAAARDHAAYWHRVATQLAPRAPHHVVHTKTNPHRPAAAGVVDLTERGGASVVGLVQTIRAWPRSGSTAPPDQAWDVGLHASDLDGDLVHRNRFAQLIGLAVIHKLRLEADYRRHMRALGADPDWGMRVLEGLFGRRAQWGMADFYPATTRMPTGVTFANADVRGTGVQCTWVLQGTMLVRVHHHLRAHKLVGWWHSGLAHDIDGIAYSVEFASSGNAASPRQLYVLAKSRRGLADKGAMDAQVCALLALCAQCINKV